MPQKIVYRLSVTASMPITDNDTDDPNFYTVASATDPRFKREIERAAFKCLKRMEQDCDVELLDYSIEDDA